MSAPVDVSGGAADPAADALTAPDAQWRRLSPRMLLIHPIREVGRSLPALLGLLFAGTSSGNGEWFSLGGLALVVGISLLRWFTTRYQITPERVQLRTGLFRRRTVSTPADRVRTVDITAHALHRVLGLAKVAIGTGVSDRKREGLVLDGLPTAAARSLRSELLHRADRLNTGPARADADAAWAPPQHNAGPADNAGPAAVSAQAPPDTVVTRLNPSWLRYAPFTLSGALTGLAIVGFGWRVLDQTRFDLRRVGAVRSAGDYLRATRPWVDVVEVAVAVVALVSLLSVIGYLLAFWNFTLSRHQGGTVHVSRGLITARATSIEERRLLGVELSEPLLLRAVGGARVLAVATGLRIGRGAERGGTLLVPPCPVAEARRAASVLMDDPAAVSTGLRTHGAGARWRRLVRAVGPALVLLAGLTALWLAGAVPGWASLVGLVPVLLAVPLALDRYRNLGHALTPAFLVSRSGSLLRRRIVLSRAGVIGWNVRATVFQRRAGLVTLTATTAAGRQAYEVSDVPEAAALELADEAAQGLLREFLLPVQRPAVA
ncbi:PH domain-containing protein [Jatrophihabitans lederbergiae]|uniref:PH domain-containing protein n=1 Tax=Jatrophihabitans lederbergiae TaxID=3075547 RepID=A0ABU2JGN6_9ACTN|nr:PH domain-containing protein [Jatrophihabitans sp. DSM 44399]MDT0263859.1 PH domain-containing protein [Jatrophihabitans sp. DSM 44399]